jgi:hypothetical protein
MRIKFISFLKRPGFMIVLHISILFDGEFHIPEKKMGALTFIKN